MTSLDSDLRQSVQVALRALDHKRLLYRSLETHPTDLLYRDCIAKAKADTYADAIQQFQIALTHQGRSHDDT
jgi:hypothetical protein